MSIEILGGDDVNRTPHAVESEQVLLGAILLRGEIVTEVRSLGLQPDHLWRRDHREILMAAFELDEQHLIPELMLVKDRVGNRLDGGVAYLSQLTDFGIRLPRNNIVEHVRKIHATLAARKQQALVARYAQDLARDPAVSSNGGVVRLTESGVDPIQWTVSLS